MPSLEAIGPYRVVRRVIETGFSLTCLAEHTGEHDAHRLYVRHVPDPDKRAAIAASYAWSTTIRHERIVAALDSGVEGDWVYVALAAEPGRPLATLSSTDEEPRPLPPDLVASIGVDIAVGLHTGHEHERRGFVHHALRMDALFVDRFGRAVVEGIFVDPIVASETMAEVSRLLASPERVAGGPFDRRGDVYVLGAILWTLLTGRVLFGEAPTPTAALDAILREYPPAPSSIVRDIPPTLDEVILRALAKDPRDRPATAMDFATRLLAAVDTGSARSKLADRVRLESTRPPPLDLTPARGPELADESTDTDSSIASPAGERKVTEQLGNLSAFADDDEDIPTTVATREQLAAGSAAQRPAPSRAAPPPRDEVPKAPPQKVKVPEEFRETKKAKPTPTLGRGAAAAPGARAFAPATATIRGFGAPPRPVSSPPAAAAVPRPRPGTLPRVDREDEPEADATIVERNPFFAKKETPAQPVYDENVQFTVYRPAVVEPMRWYTLLSFAHLSEKRPGAPDEEPDPATEVARQAKLILGESADRFRATSQDSAEAVPREGLLTFVPSGDGLEFNPRQRTFSWTEAVHREEFRVRALPEVEGRVARGRMSVYLGRLLLADVTIAIRVDSGAARLPSLTSSAKADSARPYRKIFASYSHRDRAVVEEIESYARAVGDEFVRDWVHLRTGELWSERLKQLIGQSDVFQLFWSTNSMRSPFVRQEWEHALSLRRPNFVRPTYWEEPLPEARDEGLPPAALRALHFQRLKFDKPSVSIASPDSGEEEHEATKLMSLHERPTPASVRPGDYAPLESDYDDRTEVSELARAAPSRSPAIPPMPPAPQASAAAFAARPSATGPHLPPSAGFGQPFASADAPPTTSTGTHPLATIGGAYGAQASGFPPAGGGYAGATGPPPPPFRQSAIETQQLPRPDLGAGTRARNSRLGTLLLALACIVIAALALFATLYLLRR